MREAVRAWSDGVVDQHVVRVGYFGSYARGDAGVGSDLDLIIVVDESATPWEQRAAEWDTTPLPVPADLLVYTREEWERLDPSRRFTRTLATEAVWVYVAAGA